jgi:hypothetical protein
MKRNTMHTINEGRKEKNEKKERKGTDERGSFGGRKRKRITIQAATRKRLNAT